MASSHWDTSLLGDILPPPPPRAAGPPPQSRPREVQREGNQAPSTAVPLGAWGHKMTGRPGPLAQRLP